MVCALTKSEVNAHYLKYNWISDDPRLVAMADRLVNLYEQTKQQQRKTKRDFTSAFNVILSSFDIFNAYEGFNLYIPTNNNLFSGKLKRHPTYTTEIKDCIKWLIAEDYLNEAAKVTRPKIKDSKKRQWLPKAYTLSDKWLTQVSDKPLSSHQLMRRNPLAGYYELREKIDDAKVAIQPSDSQLSQHKDLLSETNKTLEAYDKFMGNIVTSIGSKPLSPAQLSMTRVFSNKSFDQGGRLYSAVQNYKKETRKYLYFNNDPTIEIDYSSFHPHLIYHQAGLKFDGNDPYEISGYEREHIKVAFNIMLNRKGSEGNQSAAATISNELVISRASAEALEQAITTLHAPIADHFNSGAGLLLQRIDADIARAIVDHFISVLKRPIVSVHDSFIVSVRDTESLILLMADNYRIIVGLEATMAGIKSTSQKFSEPLTDAINLCFEQQTDGMSGAYWNALIAQEGVVDPDRIAVEKEDAIDKEVL